MPAIFIRRWLPFRLFSACPLRNVLIYIATSIIFIYEKIIIIFYLFVNKKNIISTKIQFIYLIAGIYLFIIGILSFKMVKGITDN